MINTTPRSGQLGLQWIDRLLPSLGRPVREDRRPPRAPLTIEIGAATGVKCEPRPASKVVMMPYIAPEPDCVGRETVIRRCWPCRLVTR